MKSKIKIFLIILFLNFSLYAQNCKPQVCVEEYKKNLIKEVCIPNGYWISFLRTDSKDIDFNADSLPDFIFDWNKPKLEDKDTLFISFYKQNQDSTFSFYKTFKNLLPIFLNSYDHAPKDSSAYKIFNCYGDGYPLRDLTIGTGTIEITLRLDALSSYYLKYLYNKRKNNWFLTVFEEKIDYPDGLQIIPHPIPPKGESIDEFSYENYLCQ